MQKKMGFTLLETVLVLAIVGMMMAYGAKRYWHYQQTTQHIIVPSDIQRLFNRSKKYFVIAGCEKNNTGLCHYQPNINNDLHLPELAHGRSPLVTQYQVNIVNTGLTKKNKTAIYQITITAMLNRNLTQAKIESLEKEWDADEIKSDPSMLKIIWTQTP